MLKKIGGIVALAAMCGLSLFLLNCGSSSSRPSGLLYVLTQGINGAGNNVSSFSINFANGDLSLINSNAQTCAVGSVCGLPLDILLDPTSTVAFVLNQGIPCSEQTNSAGTWVCASGSIPVPPSILPYTVGGNGSLSEPQSAVTWSCANTGIGPCSDQAIAMVRDPAGQFLYVINQGSYPSPGFPASSSTFASCPHLPTGPTDVCPSISVLTMQPGSTTLTLASGSPFYLSKIPSALSVINFTPTGSTTPQEFLYVTNNQDICSLNCIPPSPNNDSTVSAYTVGSTGTLTEQVNSPYAIAAADPIAITAVNTNPPAQNTGGVFVYVGNQDPNGGHVYPFQVCTVVGNNGCTQSDVQNNLMTPLTTCPQISCNVPPTSAGQQPAAMLVDPTNNFLYVLSKGSNTLYGFRINTTAGVLTALSPASQPTGAAPVAMALQPPVGSSAQFLYVSNSGSSSITGFNISTTTGSMNSPITAVAPSNPSGMVAK